MSLPIVFRNGTASEISHYAFYILDHYGRANLRILNNEIDGCGKAFMGSTGGREFDIRGNHITNLKADRVWEHFPNTRDGNQAAISQVEFTRNIVSFEKGGTSFFAPRFPNKPAGLGEAVKINRNRFTNVDGTAWTYSKIPGSEPVVGNNLLK